jgi:hypothetical protein
VVGIVVGVSVAVVVLIVAAFVYVRRLNASQQPKTATSTTTAASTAGPTAGANRAAGDPVDVKSIAIDVLKSPANKGPNTIKSPGGGEVNRRSTTTPRAQATPET